MKLLTFENNKSILQNTKSLNALDRSEQADWSKSTEKSLWQERGELSVSMLPNQFKVMGEGKRTEWNECK